MVVYADSIDSYSQLPRLQQRSQGLRSNSTESAFGRENVVHSYRDIVDQKLPMMKANIAAHQGAQAGNSNPKKAINRVIQWEKPYINEAIQPDRSYEQQVRWAPAHAAKSCNNSIERIILKNNKTSHNS